MNEMRKGFDFNMGLNASVEACRISPDESSMKMLTKNIVFSQWRFEEFWILRCADYIPTWILYAGVWRLGVSDAVMQVSRDFAVWGRAFHVFCGICESSFLFLCCLINLKGLALCNVVVEAEGLVCMLHANNTALCYSCIPQLHFNPMEEPMAN